MLKKLTVSVFVLSLIFIVAACGSSSDTNDSDPVAIVNGVEITRAAFEAELEFEMTGYQKQGYQLKEEEIKMVREQVVERLINNILLLEAAVEAGITRDSVDIEAELVQIKQGFEDESKFNDALEESGFTLDEFKDLVIESIMIENLFEAELKLSSLEVSDEEVQDAMEEFMATLGDGADDLNAEDLQEYFAYSLKQEKANQLKAAYIEELRKGSEIEYFDL